ncbi:MAG: type IV pilus assembly protein PilM [Armatimonadetes bacterium]|nr:type IV pilus assembly protein PilM [Armatimonadota bacterium]
MAKRLTSVVGVDIGSQMIKVAEIRLKGRSPEITAVGMTPTPEGSVDHTGVYNPDEVGAALKKLLSECGSTTKQAVVSIAGQASVLVRTIEVPRMNDEELKDHMRWEIERNIPFAESNVLSDYKPLPDEDPNSPNMDVVLAIAPQSAIETVVSVMKKAGRAAVAIDVEPLGIARSLTQGYEDDYRDQMICVVDMGHKSSSINIYKSGKLLQPRQIPIGGEMFTRAIADSFGITFEEAEEIKLNKARIPDSVIASAGQDNLSAFGFSFDPSATSGYADPNAPVANPFLAPPAADIPAVPDNPFIAPLDTGAEPGPEPSDAGDMQVPPSAYEAEVPPAAPEPADAPAYTYGGHDPYAGAPSGGDVHAAPPADQPMAPPPATDYAPPVDHGLAVPDHGSDDPDTLRIYNAMSSVLDEFLAEIRRSIDYFRSRGGEINRIMISGGGTKLHGMKEYIAASLGLECDAMDPFRHLNLVGKKVASGYVHEHAQEFAVAVGNGLFIVY